VKVSFGESKFKLNVSSTYLSRSHQTLSTVEIMIFLTLPYSASQL